MALTPGTKILISDLNLMPRSFASTAARDAYYTANPGLKVPGIVAVIGTGASYREYKWDGTAWRLWEARDVSSLITPVGGWTVDAKRAVVASGVVTLVIALTKVTGAWGTAALDSNNGAVLTVDPALAWSILPGVRLAPAPALVTSGSRWGSFAWATHSAGLALNFEAAIGPYIAAGGWAHGVITWPIG